MEQLSAMRIDQQNKFYFTGGVVLCFAGAVCFSTKAVIVKLAYQETPVDAVSLLALRMIFSLPFFIVTAIMSSGRQTNVRFTPKQWLGVALVGTLGYYLSSLLDFLGLQYISAGAERLILFIYPTFVLFMMAIFFKQKITTIQIVALLITYVGLVIAFLGEVSFSSEHNTNVVLGSVLILTCALTFAMYIVGSGRLIPVVGASKFNSYAMSFASVGVLLHFFITTEHSLLDFPAPVYGYGVLMALLSTVIPSYMISAGIKRIGSGNAAIVGSIGPVSTIIQAYFFLGEPITLPQLLGTFLILIGVLIIGRKK